MRKHAKEPWEMYEQGDWSGLFSVRDANNRRIAKDLTEDQAKLVLCIPDMRDLLLESTTWLGNEVRTADWYERRDAVLKKAGII